MKYYMYHDNDDQGFFQKKGNSKSKRRTEDDEYQPRVDPKRKKNRDFTAERKAKRGEE